MAHCSKPCVDCSAYAGDVICPGCIECLYSQEVMSFVRSHVSGPRDIGVERRLLAMEVTGFYVWDDRAVQMWSNCTPRHGHYVKAEFPKGFFECACSSAHLPAMATFLLAMLSWGGNITAASLHNCVLEFRLSHPTNCCQWLL